MKYVIHSVANMLARELASKLEQFERLTLQYFHLAASQNLDFLLRASQFYCVLILHESNEPLM